MRQRLNHFDRGLTQVLLQYCECLTKTFHKRNQDHDDLSNINNRKLCLSTFATCEEDEALGHEDHITFYGQSMHMIRSFQMLHRGKMYKMNLFIMCLICMWLPVYASQNHTYTLVTHQIHTNFISDVKHLVKLLYLSSIVKGQQC